LRVVVRLRRLQAALARFEATLRHRFEARKESVAAERSPDAFPATYPTDRQ
jgi:hypothetical protein